MPSESFDFMLQDSQGTLVKPMNPRDFDLEEYADYEDRLRERNQQFWAAPSGIAVYRRFRVPQVFAGTCRDPEFSLALQLSALSQSMSYAADIPNFLEPWYGIGTVASAFGADYHWADTQAPSIPARFASVAQALEHEPLPIEETEIGRQTLRMIEYFLDRTKGRVPMSLTDSQSPLNVASHLVESSSFYMSFIEEPEGLERLLARISGLIVEFTRKQMALIGDALVWPGHGFPSSRWFKGLGMSDDAMVSLSPRHYRELAAPSIGATGRPFDGTAFHSCGNWSSRIAAVKTIPDLVMVDGAFSEETDPACNPCEPFAEGFAGTGITVNARIVGDPKAVITRFQRLWRPNLKLVVTTYCSSPNEQEEAHRRIHAGTD
jgi:hypothetical protein